MQDQQFFSQWIEQSLPSTVNYSGLLQLDALAGDAGFRRYFRVNAKPSVIAVNSPPKKKRMLNMLVSLYFFNLKGL